MIYVRVYTCIYTHTHSHTLRVGRTGTAKIVDLNEEQAQVAWAGFGGKIWVDFWQIVSVCIV